MFENGSGYVRLHCLGHDILVLCLVRFYAILFRLIARPVWRAYIVDWYLGKSSLLEQQINRIGFIYGHSNIHQSIDQL